MKGADAALAALSEWLEAWSGYEVEVVESVAAPGGLVLFTLRQRGTGAVSGLPFEGDLFQLWTVRDGRPIRMEMFFDRDRARTAAGLD